jgi:putative membrane-bound dehydrogenase-like protein
MKKLILGISLLLLGCQEKQRPNLANTPELQKALQSIQVLDGFEVELVAAEPLVEDPVAMEIDEDGNWYVAEMPGYPLDLSKKGQIRKLIDTNGDGYPDKSIVFADSLTLPMGLMRWKKGILVADSPNILYFEDTDGDQKADKREVILTGFSLSNPQHNMNTPKFGIDNWIYLGHSGAINSFSYENIFGDKGTEITFPNKPNAAFLPKNGNGRNVRFKPDSYQVESLSGETQYGHTTDPWGRRFYTDNANHLFHEVIDARYVNANKNLVIADAMEKIPDHGNACEIYPISENPNHQLLTDVGVVTSSCGITWYDGGAFGEKYNKVTFVGEPVHNLVHADIIESLGATFQGKRLVEKKEFLASKDPWFRPVNFYVGPDGALYVVDYYRQLVEHPEWMSDEVNKSGALYNGSTKGRIYRITKKGAGPMDWMKSVKLSATSSADLVKLLTHKNGWYRRTAQRLLFDRKDKSVTPLLKELIADDKALGGVQALWLLHDSGNLDAKDLANALGSSTEGIRENALQVADRMIDKPGFANNPTLQKQLIGLADDPSARVRFQWLCSSSYLHLPNSAPLRAKILAKDIEDQWAGIAAIAASQDTEEALLKSYIQTLGTSPSKGKSTFFSYLAATLVKKGDPAFLTLAIDQNPSNDWWQAAIWYGVATLIKEAGVPFPLEEKQKEALLASFMQTNQPELRTSILSLFKSLGLPKNTTQFALVEQRFNQSKDAQFQRDALSLLALRGDAKTQATLIHYLSSKSPVHLQLGAVESLPNTIAKTDLQKINTYYPSLSVPVKKAWIAYLLEHENQVTTLLQEVKKNNIKRSDLEWPQIVGLMNYYDTGIRGLARSVLAIAEDRKAILQNYLPAADMAGNVQAGEKIFEANCTSCHAIKNLKGVDFGPNLNTLKSRNALSIITEIINPNNSIADKYGQWELELKNGTRLTGIITSENDQTIALKLMGGSVQNISKSNIKSKKDLRVSAMPNGLEANINVKAMADLLAYIKK